MDPLDIQMHVFWYHAIDTKHVRILAKFERRLSISVLRNKSFFTKKGLSHQGQIKSIGGTSNFL
jgi:hypothetical protein